MWYKKGVAAGVPLPSTVWITENGAPQVIARGNNESRSKYIAEIFALIHEYSRFFGREARIDTISPAAQRTKLFQTFNITTTDHVVQTGHIDTYLYWSPV